MPTVDLFLISGEKAGKVTLPSEIFAAKINNQLMAQAVRVFLANQRKARAKTKTRGKVEGSGKKIWAQKGTGRARHGDRYAPIFVGGGISHGPTGKENFKLKMRKWTFLVKNRSNAEQRRHIAITGSKERVLLRLGDSNYFSRYRHHATGHTSHLRRVLQVHKR